MQYKTNFCTCCNLKIKNCSFLIKLLWSLSYFFHLFSVCTREFNDFQKQWYIFLKLSQQFLWTLYPKITFRNVYFGIIPTSQSPIKSNGKMFLCFDQVHGSHQTRRLNLTRWFDFSCLYRFPSLASSGNHWQTVSEKKWRQFQKQGVRMSRTPLSSEGGGVALS